MSSAKAIKFKLRDFSGAALTVAGGAVLTWVDCYVVETGASVAAPDRPAFVELGGGWFKVTPTLVTGQSVVGTIDGGTLAAAQVDVGWRAEDYNADVASSTLATAAALAALQAKVAILLCLAGANVIVDQVQLEPGTGNLVTDRLRGYETKAELETADDPVPSTPIITILYNGSWAGAGLLVKETNTVEED